MKNTDPKHKHTYDAQGKMTCCSQEEKINKMADKQVKKNMTIRNLYLLLYCLIFEPESKSTCYEFA